MRKILIAGAFALMSASPSTADVLAAVQGRDIAALERALAQGEAVDQRNAKGQTGLLVAVWNNDAEAAARLIAAGADVNARDQIKDSPYLVAGAQGRVQILNMILQNGADLKSTNRFGGTALIPAAEKGHPEAVLMLLAAGVDPNHVNDLGWTALMEAVVLTDGGPVAQENVRLLLEGGADPKIADADGRSALEHARARGFGEIAAMLTRAGG